MPRGKLRVYLGAAPGVGKTYDMLGEGQRRAGRGTDVVIGFMEDYGRPLTRKMAEGLESLGDVVEQITGVRQRETVPDDVVRRADQVELVDMSGEALRRRMAHGNIYPPDKTDAALANYFRLGNLTALRELAMLWAADRVEEALLRYRTDHGIQQPWGTRERVLVALSGGPEGETLIRRAKRTASRGAGGEFLAVHIQRGDGLATASPKLLARQQGLVEALGGSFHTVTSDDTAEDVLDFARQVNATQIVIGHHRRIRRRH